MKWVGVLAWLLLCGGVTGLVGSFVIPGLYRPKAKLIQRVQLNEADALFGSLGDFIGTPQMMIIDDPKAFIEGQTGPEGSLLVSEGYLVKNKIYPLQLKTIEYTSGLLRMGSLGAAGVGVIGLLFVRSRRKRIVRSTPG